MGLPIPSIILDSDGLRLDTYTFSRVDNLLESLNTELKEVTNSSDIRVITKEINTDSIRNRLDTSNKRVLSI
jgi:hypothetical protein